MKVVSIGVLVLALALVCHCKVSKELQVTLPHGGSLAGTYMTSHRGQGIRAFMGIPYAEPPIGYLRFQPPFPKLPWTGVLDATNGQRECVQAVFGASITGEEDCLYVNVYAPLEPKSNGPLPVMLYIHGGGFVTGSGSVKFYPPDYFLDHEVILVTGNYRLGALGFLSLGSSDLPGNMGLKDQHLILQWIQDNIGSFGGDPRQVTIFGESAGSASVGFHLISKQSYKLFQKAIMQSGTQYAPWAFDHFDENAKNAVTLGNALGCPLNNPKKDMDSFINCMKKLKVEDIIRVGFEVLSPKKVPFLPNIEASIEGFVQKSPSSYKRSIGLDVPILIGVNSQEGAFMSAFWLGAGPESYDAWNWQNEQLDEPILQMSNLNGLQDKAKQRLRSMAKDYYFKNGGFDKSNFNNVTDFFSDGYFVSPMDDFLVNRLVTNDNSADTFVYLFAHRGAVTFPDLFPAFGYPEIKLDHDLGVSHVDDLIYLFPMGENLMPHVVPTNVDAFIQSTLTEMWVKFATNGRPSSETVENVTWLPARGYPLDFLRIGNYGQPEKSIVGMESGLFEERVNLWRQLKSITVDDKDALAGKGRDEL